MESAKFKQGEKSFNYFIGYAGNSVIRPLCILLPQMSGFIRLFDNGCKNMSFMIKDDRVLTKFNGIWGKIKGLLGLHSEPIYDEKYIKTKARLFNGDIYTTFWREKIQKEGIHYTCIAVIIRDSIIRMDIFKRMEIRCKREKDDQLYRR